MCGIFCSFDKEKVLELFRLNSYRGNHSYSVFNVFKYDPIEGILYRDLGNFDIGKLSNYGYKICHVQAPTTSLRTIESVHPAKFKGSFLWHNGLIKSFDIKRLQEKHNTEVSWDTFLLLFELLDENWLNNLSEINGSFACVFVDEGTIYLFRNEISPLFYDDMLNISSVRFEGSKSLPPNKIFVLDLKNKSLKDTGLQFLTKENPYYFND